MADLPRHPPEARQDPPGTDRRTHTAWDVLTSHPASTSSPRGEHNIKAPVAGPPHPRDPPRPALHLSLFLSTQAGLPRTHLSLHLSSCHETLRFCMCLFVSATFRHLGGFPESPNPSVSVFVLFPEIYYSYPHQRKTQESQVHSVLCGHPEDDESFPTTLREKSEAGLKTSPSPRPRPMNFLRHGGPTIVGHHSFLPLI